MCSGIGFYTQHANTDFFSSVYNCIYTRIFVQFICPEQGLATKQRALSASFKRVFTPLEVTVVTQQTSEMLSLQNVHCTLCSVPVRYFYNTVLIVETTQMEKRLKHVKFLIFVKNSAFFQVNEILIGNSHMT